MDQRLIMPPATSPQPRIGGHILVDNLIAHGVETVFGVPGESFLAVLDGFYARQDRIRFIICRQEGGAANMADAHGKLTGRPGVCMVTRGPGATNASIGVHTAFQDSTPMVLLIGQVGGDFVDREAFQEIDYRQMFRPIAKWVAQIDRAERIPEYVSHAFHVAMSGRPGPVVLALPEDMLTQEATVADLAHYQTVQAAPAPADIARFAGLLAAANAPVVVLGGSGWDQAARANIRAFAEAWQLPVGCAFRFQDLFDNTHPQYVGDVGIGINPKLAARIRDADLVVAIGPRLGEMTTGGYTLLAAPRSTQKLIHVHAGADELGRVYQGELLINAGMQRFAEAVRELKPAAPVGWGQRTREANAEYLANRVPQAMPGALDLAAVVLTCQELLPDDAILTNGAGNYSGWVHRFYQHRKFRTQLAPTSGAMGYGVPSAVAAAITHPERTVVSFSGDGCFLMNGQEMATAAQYDAKVIFVVINNGMYGTIRMHQEREYPARISGTPLRNPDFAAMARAFGHAGEIITRTDEFRPALERALAAPGSTLLELRIDPEAITTRTTLAELRAQAQAKGK
ncbi:MAG: thiamine pyrophosphate-binding protein [Betaproteobacteria bacterium]|nr:thiamine pyrophosphate-binding protein [Betaproteobacteria bacterium]